MAWSIQEFGRPGCWNAKMAHSYTKTRANWTHFFPCKMSISKMKTTITRLGDSVMILCHPKSHSPSKSEHVSFEKFDLSNVCAKWWACLIQSNTQNICSLLLWMGLFVLFETWKKTQLFRSVVPKYSNRMATNNKTKPTEDEGDEKKKKRVGNGCLCAYGKMAIICFFIMCRTTCVSLPNAV